MNMNYTEIAGVLDRSGSMACIISDTMGSFNKFLEDQKNAPGIAKMTLNQFDDVFKVVYEGKDIKDAPQLTKDNYSPRGTTALLDAIGKTINTLGERLKGMKEEDRPGKVVVVIITDGFENASREFNRNQIFDMIKKQTEVYKWAFIFLGANQDAIKTGESMGISASNSLTYGATPDGVKNGMHSLSANMLHMRASTLDAADYTAKNGYFSGKDRQKQNV